MKEVGAAQDSLAYSLHTSERKPLSKWGEPWLSDGYDRIQIDQFAHRYPLISMNGGTPVVADTPAVVISLLTTGKKDKILYPYFSDRDITPTTINTQHAIFRSFPSGFLERLINLRRGVKYANTTWDLYTDAIKVTVNDKQGQPSFFLVNVFHITDGPDSVKEDLDAYCLNVGLAIAEANNWTPKEVPSKRTASYPPRYTGRADLARLLFSTCCPEFNIDAQIHQEGALALAIKPKGGHFEAVKLGMLDSKGFWDFEKAHLNAALTAIPCIQGQSGTFVETTCFIEDPSVVAQVAIVSGTLPLVEGRGIIPVRYVSGRSGVRGVLNSDTAQISVCYPEGNVEGVRISHPEIIILGELGLSHNFRVHQSTAFISNGMYKAPMPSVLKWKDLIEGLVAWNIRFKFLYQFAVTGGIYPIHREYDDFEVLGHPVIERRGYGAVAGANPYLTEHILSTVRTAALRAALQVGADTILTDGGNYKRHGPDEIAGMRIVYTETSHNQFSLCTMMQDEGDTKYQDLVRQHRDEASIQLVDKTVVSLYDVASPMEIGRKIDHIRELKPSLGAREPTEEIKRLGQLLDGAIDSKPLSTGSNNLRQRIKEEKHEW